MPPNKLHFLSSENQTLAHSHLRSFVPKMTSNYYIRINSQYWYDKCSFASAFEEGKIHSQWSLLPLSGHCMMSGIIKKEWISIAGGENNKIEPRLS